METLPNFVSFDYDSDRSNAGPRWSKWLKRLEILFDAMNITDDKRKRALLLFYAGERVSDIYEVNKGETEEKYADTKKVLTDHFKPKTNIQMSIYNFRNTKQKSEQTLDDYATELRQLAQTCEFADIDSEILSQIIQNCTSTRLRRQALREPDKKLKDILDIGRAQEMSEKQASEMEKDTGQIHAVRKFAKHQNQKHTPKKSFHKQNPVSEVKKKGVCIYCGGNFPHSGECPAKGKLCSYCKKPNHFKAACLKLKKKETVHEIIEDKTETNSDDDYCYVVTDKKHTKTPNTKIKINNVDVMVKVDTGASVNIIDETTYKQIGNPKLSKTTPRLYSYANTEPIPVIGRCDLTVETRHCISVLPFTVVKGNFGSLLGCESSQQLQLVKFINTVTNTNDIDTKYSGLFTGIGKLKNTSVKLHIDESVTPVANRHRRTPFHLREKVDAEINKLLNEDIIEKVEGEPTPWVSPIVTPPKKDPDSIRICIDMREPNRAIQRERHVMPTLDEIVTDLNGATVFSKLDLRSGYHQLELDPESRYITTFSTHRGLFRYKRLNFGISSAAEIFQETIHNVIHDIKHTKNISDDILIYGKNTAEHDIALHATLTRLQERGLTLNRNKCEFHKSSISFFGLVFSKDGIAPDPKKIEGIQNMNPPVNSSEVKSFLGMVSYCSRFIPDYATTSEPLRRLTKKDTKWEWNSDQQIAFELLKDKLSSSSKTVYFDPNKPIDVIVDASPVGLGAMLTQTHGVISFASRALTDVETRYSQTEREALAVVWACEHFNMYLNGAKHFTVTTDHKPLVHVWKKRNPPLRLERWGLRLQPYKYEIRYKPGADNPADYMSRHPPQQPTQKQPRDIVEEYVNFIAETSVPNAMTINEVREATLQDKTLQKVREYIHSGRWFEIKTITDTYIDIHELQEFQNIHEELTCHIDGIILRGSRIVIPKQLREKAVQLAHEGHQGMNKTKAFIRSKVWFPGINDMVEQKIRQCLACQSTCLKTPKLEPLQMSEMPDGPWENLSADFCGPLPSGHYLLVVTDEYSRYPVVEIMKSTSAIATIPVFDKILSQYGIPKTIKTDNGSPFNSHEFAKFAQFCGFHHRRITPRWPRANAQAEAFNKPLMKAIRSAKIEEKPWKQEMYKFLRQYRCSPHASTGFTPHRLLFGRDPKTRLPHLSITPENKDINITDHQAKQNDAQAKLKMKSYADAANAAKQSNLNIGDTVLMKEDKQNKLSSTFNPHPLIVTQKKGNMITATSCYDDRNTTRNSSYFKKVPDSFQNTVKSSLTDGGEDPMTETTAENTMPVTSQTPQQQTTSRPMTPQQTTSRPMTPQQQTTSRPMTPQQQQTTSRPMRVKKIPNRLKGNKQPAISISYSLCIARSTALDWRTGDHVL